MYACTEYVLWLAATYSIGASSVCKCVVGCDCWCGAADWLRPMCKHAGLKPCCIDGCCSQFESWEQSAYGTRAASRRGGKAVTAADRVSDAAAIYLERLLSVVARVSGKHLVLLNLYHPFECITVVAY